MGRVNTIFSNQKTDISAGLYFLCRLFWGPDLQQCREMVQGSFGDIFSALKSILSEDGVAALAAFDVFLGEKPDPDALCRELQATYVRLFVSSKDGIAAPLYQSCYLFDGAPLMGPPALRMQERLAAAGLSVSGQGNEPPDCLAVELEYLYFLLAKAPEENGPESADPAIDFAQNELSSWITLFTDRLARVPDAGPYTFAAVLICDIVRLISYPSVSNLTSDL